MDVQSEPLVLFVVEDDPKDRQFLSRELEYSGFENGVFFFSDVEEMITSIQRKREKYGQTPYSVPSYILIDSSTQKSNFREMYALIKNTDVLQSIPVILMMGSKWEEEYWRSQNFDVAEYFLKPVNCQSLKYILTNRERTYSF